MSRTLEPPSTGPGIDDASQTLLSHMAALVKCSGEISGASSNDGQLWNAARRSS